MWGRGLIDRNEAAVRILEIKNLRKIYVHCHIIAEDGTMNPMDFTNIPHLL